MLPPDCHRLPCELSAFRVPFWSVWWAPNYILEPTAIRQSFLVTMSDISNMFYNQRRLSREELWRRWVGSWQGEAVTDPTVMHSQWQSVVNAGGSCQGAKWWSPCDQKKEGKLLGLWQSAPCLEYDTTHRHWDYKTVKEISAVLKIPGNFVFFFESKLYRSCLENLFGLISPSSSSPTYQVKLYNKRPRTGYATTCPWYLPFWFKTRKPTWVAGRSSQGQVGVE